MIDKPLKPAPALCSHPSAPPHQSARQAKEALHIRDLAEADRDEAVAQKEAALAAAAEAERLRQEVGAPGQAKSRRGGEVGRLALGRRNLAAISAGCSGCCWGDGDMYMRKTSGRGRGNICVRENEHAQLVLTC